MKLLPRRRRQDETQQAAVVDRLNTIVAAIGDASEGRIVLPWMTSEATTREAPQPVTLAAARSSHLSPEDDHGSAVVRDARVG